MSLTSNSGTCGIGETCSVSIPTSDANPNCDDGYDLTSDQDSLSWVSIDNVMEEIEFSPSEGTTLGEIVFSFIATYTGFPSIQINLA